MKPLGPEVAFKTFGAALKHWREKKVWTLDQAAKRFEIDPTYLSRIERGPLNKYKPPEAIPTVFRWAKELDLNLHPEEHAHFVELALRDRHGEDWLWDSCDPDAWWWFSRAWAPPVERGFADTLKGVGSVHECIGLAAEAALKREVGDLGFRKEHDAPWAIWRIEKQTQGPTTAKKKGGKRNGR